MRRYRAARHAGVMASSTQSLPAFSDALADAVAAAGRSVVAIHARHRIPSSGVLWRPGILVTADHTLRRSEEITVTLPDNREATATLAGRDPGSDLAVLKIDAPGVDAAKTAPAASLKTGHLVLAIGRRGANGVSASLGVIGALSGPWRTWRGGQIEQFIRPDVSLYPGFSGGPLVNTEGEVLGINTSALTRGMGVTVPASTVNRVADELLKRGHIARGYLGVGLHPVQLPDSHTGLIVLSVAPGGPAAKAGIFVGDVLVSIEGKTISDTDDVQTHLGSESIGKALKATIIRGGQTIEVAITPEERPRGGC